MDKHKVNNSVNYMMINVIISLIPVIAFSVYENGGRSLQIILLAILGSIVSEVLWNKLLKQKITIMDFSAVITGVLLAFLLPIDVPLWIPVVGGVFGIIIVKQFFGGVGQNIVNPALASLAFLTVSWSGILNTTTGSVISKNAYIAIIIAGVYLLVTKVISWRTTVVYLLSIILIGTAVNGQAFVFGNSDFNSMASMLMLGGVYFVNDFAVLPKTKMAKYLLGFGAGALTVLFCVYGEKVNGIMYAVLIMNISIPLIDKFFAPKEKGGVLSEK